MKIGVGTNSEYLEEQAKQAFVTTGFSLRPPSSFQLKMDNICKLIISV